MASVETARLEPELEIICPAWYPEIGKLTEAVPLLADQGVTAIEIGVPSAEYFERRDPGKLGTLVEKLSLCGVRARSVHAPFGPDLDVSSLNDETHERGVEVLIDSIEFAGAVGARAVVVHPGDRLDGSRTRKRQLERAHGVLRELSTVARESGVVLAVENLPPDYLGHTPEEILGLLDDTEPGSVSVCFDCGHANLSGRFIEFARALLPRSSVTHVHDNDGTSDQHRLPGAGVIDWRSFAEVWLACRCSPAIVLECQSPAPLIWSEAFQVLRKALG